MSEPSNYCIFSAESIEELAERIYAMLPEDVFVTVMFMEYDEETDIFTIGPPTNGMPSMEVARNEKRMDKVIDLVGPHPPWSYDTEKYPVMLFSIESEKFTFGFVGITLSREIKDFDDYKVIYLVRDFIRMHLPDCYICDDDEYVDAAYLYGALSNPKVCYEDDEFADD